MVNLNALIFSLLMTVLTSAYSQTPTITSLKCEGNGEIKVMPDWTIVYIETTSKDLHFNNTVQELNKKASMLEKEIVAAGFDKTDLKTTGYVVNKNINYTNGSPVDSGYMGSQSFTLEFSNDQQKLIKLVKTLSDSKVGITFNFSFSLSQKKQDETEKELIKRAVIDATSKAKILAESAGVTLKRIIDIDYSKQDIGPRPYMAAMAKGPQMESTEFSGFNVKDLEMNDKVVVTWEIDQQKQ